MERENLVCNPVLRIVGDMVVVLGALGGVTSGVVSRGSQIKLCNLRREGHHLVGCHSFSHSAQGI
jgi:hypothetical protein